MPILEQLLCVECTSEGCKSVVLRDRIGDEKVAEAEKTGLSLEAWLMIGLVVSVGLSTLVIAVVSAGKTTVFSPYQNDDEFQEQNLR